MVWHPNLKRRAPVERRTSKKQLIAIRGACKNLIAFFQLDPLSAYKVLKNQFPQYIPIATKLAIAISLLVVMGVVSVGVIIGNNQKHLLEEELNKYAVTLLQQMSDSAKEPILADDQLILEIITHSVTKHEGILGAAIFNDEMVRISRAGVQADAISGKVLAFFKNNEDEAYFTEKPQSLMLGVDAITSFISPIKFNHLKVGYVLLVFDNSKLSKATRETVVTIVTVTILMVLLGIILAIYFSHWLTRPLTKILEASKAISDGHYNVFLSERRNDELGILMSSMNKMGQGLFQKQQVEAVFSRYVSPQVARKAIGEIAGLEEIKLGGRHIEASVLFADIVGFTSLSENTSADEVSKILNYYFSLIAKAANVCHGYIDKYIGDCAMIVFGVPYEVDNNRFNSLSCAWMIMKLVEEINEQRAVKNLPTVQFRIGANSGTMLAGNIGSEHRMEYTVVGDAVNLASRLSHAGDIGKTMLTAEVLEHDAVRKKIVAHPEGEIKLRGKKKPSKLYSLQDIRNPFKQKILDEMAKLMKENW